MTERSSSSATVNVRAHDRAGGRVKVDAHQRGRIRGSVGNGRTNDPDDVLEVKRILAKLGRYPAGEEPGPILDRDLDHAIRGYQADRDLRQDGWLDAIGETFASLWEDAKALTGLYDDLDIPVIGALQWPLATALPGTVTWADQQMQAVQQTFGTLNRIDQTLGRKRGFQLADEFLARFRSGSGEPRALTRAEVEQEPALMRAERANRLSFEASTFLGRTSDNDLNRKIADLPNGKPVQLADHWESKVELKDYADRPGSYFAFGRTGIRSDGAFTATRQGATITYTGTVTHRLDSRPRQENVKGAIGDPYDFALDQPGGVEASILQANGKAKPFEMTSRYREKVTAVVQERPDGRRILRSAAWTPAE